MDPDTGNSTDPSGNSANATESASETTSSATKVTTQGKPVVHIPDTSNTDPGYEIVTEEDEEGHCIWYGQCGKGWNKGRLVSSALGPSLRVLTGILDCAFKIRPLLEQRTNCFIS